MSAPQRPKGCAIVWFALVTVFIAALGVALLVNGVHSLVRPTTCQGQVMTDLDGCEIVHTGTGHGRSEVQVYWPGGNTAGIARLVPALRSRDQVRTSDREEGVFLLLASAGAAAVTAYLIRLFVRSRRSTRPGGHR